MPFRRNDFHGSRIYESDPPPSAASQFDFNISMTIAWVKLQLDKLPRFGAPPSISGTSPSRTSRGFSLLGAGERDARLQPVRAKMPPINDR